MQLSARGRVLAGGGRRLGADHNLGGIDDTLHPGSNEVNPHSGDPRRPGLPSVAIHPPGVAPGGGVAHPASVGEGQRTGTGRVAEPHLAAALQEGGDLGEGALVGNNPGAAQRVDHGGHFATPGLLADRRPGGDVSGPLAAASLGGELPAAGAQFAQLRLMWRHRGDRGPLAHSEVGEQLAKRRVIETREGLGIEGGGKGGEGWEIGHRVDHAARHPRAVPAALPLPATLIDQEAAVSTLLHDAVRVDRDGALTIVTIEHPPANAINKRVVLGITQALAEAEADETCRGLILTGSGPKFFAAGADITEFGSAGGDDIATAANLPMKFERSRLPIVAAINGIAFGGGCELTLGCDVRIAASNARFGQPEIKLGIIPGWGGTQRLPRLIGRAAAMELLLTGEPIDAARALQLGLVSRVVEPAALQDAARDVAGRCAAQAPLALAATKRAIADGLDRPLTEALLAERREFVGLFSTDDAREGISAFLEKRAATWTGR